MPASSTSTSHHQICIDSTDYSILNVLQQDSRLSFSKIAKKTSISVGTAYNRIKNLQEKGIIISYTARVDSSKLGYSLTAVIFVQAEGAHASTVEEQISASPNVTAVYDVTGEFGIIAIAKFRNRDNLNAFIKNLAACPIVKHTVTNVSLNTVKEDFRVKFPHKLARK